MLMRANPPHGAITVEQFLAIDFGTDRKFELVGGVIRLMTGGSPAHARVSTNILVALQHKLRGTGCRAYNSDMGVRIGEVDARYPDVSVFCGNPASAEAEKKPMFDDPVVLFEVLSPSNSQADQLEKMGDYRSIATLDTSVFVDPDDETTRVVQRLGPLSWRDDLFAQPHDVDLPALGLSLPHADIFARD